MDNPELRCNVVSTATTRDNHSEIQTIGTTRVNWFVMNFTAKAPIFTCFLSSDVLKLKRVGPSKFVACGSGAGKREQELESLGSQAKHVLNFREETPFSSAN